MKSTFTFFDKEIFSIYATFYTIIPIFLLFLFKKINLQTLVLSSIISMMSGKIIDKIIFTIFLCLLIINKKNYKEVIPIFIISVIINHYISQNIIFSKKIIQNKCFLNIFRFIIFIWFLYISYLFYKEIT